MAEQPLSAIDWLSQPLPAVQVKPKPAPAGLKLPVAKSATVPAVDVMPLDAPSLDATGLLPASVTGFPPDLWAGDTTSQLVKAIQALPRNPLPGLQALIFTVLLAEADPPIDAAPQAAFLRARVKGLQNYGAVFQARALLEQTGTAAPAVFDLWLDTALLLEEPDGPCEALKERPELSQSYATRIYCTARLGDWHTAALTYDTAQSLGLLDQTESELLAIYLDPELAEHDLPRPRPAEITPLVFRLWESAGIRLPTQALSLSYAVTDLSNNVGWKAQLEAAERLTRHGALASNHLLGLYTERKPAASGGVWDRAKNVQRIDKAIKSGNIEALATLLPETWDAFSKNGLGPAFAEMFAQELNALKLPAGTEKLALRIGLISPDYESYAARAATHDDLAFAASVAMGAPMQKPNLSVEEQALVDGFTMRSIARDPQSSLGRQLLESVTRFSKAGLNTDRVAQELAQIRAMGLEDIARRTALQWLLLEGPT